MTTRTLFYTAILLCAGNFCLAQDTATANRDRSTGQEVTSSESPRKATKGTYQVMIRIGKTQPVFSDEILIDVEKARDENEVKYLQLGENAKVKILPRKTIEAPGFTPLEEVTYVEQF